MTLQDRMKIGVGKSTNVFMLADPLAVLEENEIHLGFSSNFRDPKDTWDEVFLHDMDVLVARSPAYLSSDVQKVRFAQTLQDQPLMSLYVFEYSFHGFSLLFHIFQFPVWHLFCLQSVGTRSV